MTKKERAAIVVERLKKEYPDSCSLEATKDYELLFATRLAAQCTDARVNMVTEVLYSRYPTLEALAAAPEEDIAEIVKPCGLFRTKARDIKLGANKIINDFGGKVPDTMEELLTIPGVGRKTANLILSDIFGHPAIVADTHCMRIAGKLGLTDSGRDPYKVEMDLKKIVEPTEQASLCHRFVHFGRDICTARSPKCSLCPLSDICRENLKNQKNKE
ncbi:MAG: endonuclease III [Clostridia bacterium]|nr:endonuclease III [Clostridia bacterium]MBQ2326903.1 endonuclease III [Clostridia bacterium]MBQ5813258.1 endonuclease III [Clostridia bacterium]